MTNNTTQVNTDSPSDEQTTNQQDVVQNILDRTGTNDNAYEVSVHVISDTGRESTSTTYDDGAYFRIGEETPQLLLKSDSLVHALTTGFDISNFTRTEGEAFEIIIEPKSIPQGISSATKKNSLEAIFTVVETDSVALMPVIEEFIENVKL